MILRAALVVLSAGAFAVGATAEEFRGALAPHLTAAPPGLLVTLERVPEPPIDLEIPAGAGVFAGSLLPMGEWQFKTLLVEPRSGRPFLLVDTDRNGVFGAGERFALTPTRHPVGRWLARLDVPAAPGGLFSRIPSELLLADRRFQLPRLPDRRYLLQSGFTFATAKVRIDRRPYFFRYAVGADMKTIDIDNGLQAIDEGRLNLDPLSPRRAWGRHGPPVFRIGRRYVATKSVDPTTRSVVIESRNPGDYKRLELYRGLAVPDFTFQDIDGRTYRLVDFRGRFVLINVWYPGCGPCADEFPYLRKAADRFGPDDLVIVGFSGSYPLAGSFKDISPASPPAWIEAEPRSVQRLVYEWLQIDATPTPILLDREGRVRVLQRGGKRPLRGDELLRTLEREIGKGRRPDHLEFLAR